MRPARILDIDREFSDRLRVAEQPGLLHTIAAVLAHSGDSWFWAIGLAAVYAAVPNARVWAVSLFLAILGLAAVVMAIKFVVRRRRPEGEWGSIYRRADPHSFPSGHAARAALLATLVTAWGPPWLRPVLLLWAPAMSLSRVILGLHYLSDVVGGILIGVAAAAAWIWLLR
jgi:undecaprenyl-diphosphatase